MSGRCIVCEKTGAWAMALRWGAGQLPLRTYETRSLDECRQELARHPSSFLVVEATTANLEHVVQLLGESRQCFPESRVVVVADRALERCEDALRQAGALHVTFSTRRLHLIARMARRHLPAVVSTDDSFRDAIEARMPWSAS